MVTYTVSTFPIASYGVFPCLCPNGSYIAIVGYPTEGVPTDDPHYGHVENTTYALARKTALTDWAISKVLRVNKDPANSGATGATGLQSLTETIIETYRGWQMVEHVGADGTYYYAYKGSIISPHFSSMALAKAWVDSVIAEVPAQLLRVGNTIFMFWLNDWNDAPLSSKIGVSKSMNNGLDWTDLNGVANGWTIIKSVAGQYYDISGAGGIVKVKSPNPNRIIVPYSRLTTTPPNYICACLYSDDGENSTPSSWYSSPDVPITYPPAIFNRSYDEPVVVETSEGGLLMYMRGGSTDTYISKSFSDTGGATWRDTVADTAFPICNMNIGVYRLLWESIGYPKGLLVAIWSTNSRYPDGVGNRLGPMEIKYSYDDGVSWEANQLLPLQAGDEGYARIAKYADNSGWLLVWIVRAGMGGSPSYPKRCDVVGYPPSRVFNKFLFAHWQDATQNPVHPVAIP